MAFYGAIVKPGKALPFVPPPDNWNLHLSQAALLASVPEGHRVSLCVRHQDEAPIVVCTLVAGRLDSVLLDLYFSRYSEFTGELAGSSTPPHM